MTDWPANQRTLLATELPAQFGVRDNFRVRSPIPPVGPIRAQSIQILSQEGDCRAHPFYSSADQAQAGSTRALPRRRLLSALLIFGAIVPKRSGDGSGRR